MVKVMEEGLRLVVMEGRDYLKQILEVQTGEQDLVTLSSGQM